MNDKVTEGKGGSGISKDRIFVRAPDTKISQEHGAPVQPTIYIKR